MTIFIMKCIAVTSVLVIIRKRNDQKAISTTALECLTMTVSIRLKLESGVSSDIKLLIHLNFQLAIKIGTLQRKQSSAFFLLALNSRDRLGTCSYRQKLSWAHGFQENISTSLLARSRLVMKITDKLHCIHIG